MCPPPLAFGARPVAIVIGPTISPAIRGSAEHPCPSYLPAFIPSLPACGPPSFPPSLLSAPLLLILQLLLVLCSSTSPLFQIFKPDSCQVRPHAEEAKKKAVRLALWQPGGLSARLDGLAGWMACLGGCPPALGRVSVVTAAWPPASQLAMHPLQPVPAIHPA